MRNVNIRHNIVAVTDHRLTTFTCGTRDRGIFPDDVVIANTATGMLALEMEILRLNADLRAGAYDVVLPDYCAAADDHMASNPRPCTNHNILFNDRIRTDVHILIDIRLSTNATLHHLFI